MVSLLSLLTFAATSAAQLITFAASLPGSPLDGQVINAAGNLFYLGLSSPATYCPSTVVANCPPVTGTVASADLTALFVEVPGGQAIYVANNGALSFTVAHSAGEGTGSFVGGFVQVTYTSSCSPTLTVLTWVAPDKSTEGILACPNTLPYTNGTYQIYAKTPAFNLTGCTALTGILPTYLPANAPFGAWQYT